MRAYCFTFFAFVANNRVETDSLMDYYFDDIVAMRIVFEFPPRESFRILVNTESLYGTCTAFADSFSITILKEVKDLLILEASFNLSPAAWGDFCFSDPAKSTKCIFEARIENPSPFSLLLLVVINKVRIECDLDD